MCYCEAALCRRRIQAGRIDVLPVGRPAEIIPAGHAAGQHRGLHAAMAASAPRPPANVRPNAPRDERLSSSQRRGRKEIGEDDNRNHDFNNTAQALGKSPQHDEEDGAQAGIQEPSN